MLLDNGPSDRQPGSAENRQPDGNPDDRERRTYGYGDGHNGKHSGKWQRPGAPLVATAERLLVDAAILPLLPPQFPP
jgi:hypothetical protein